MTRSLESTRIDWKWYYRWAAMMDKALAKAMYVKGHFADRPDSINYRRAAEMEQRMRAALNAFTKVP